MNTNTIIPESITREDLIKRAGSNIPPVRVVFDGKVFDGTFEYAQDPVASIDAFKDAVFSAFEITERVETYPGYTADEVALALDEVLSRLDGGVSQTVATEPGENPGTRRVPVGFNLKTGEAMSRTVPKSAMSLPGFRRISKSLPAWVKVGVRGGQPYVIANVIRDDQGRLDGVFGMIRDWADHNSIYLGQAVNLSFEFIDRTQVQPRNVALTEINQRAINLLVRQPLSNTIRLANLRQSPKTGMLLYGPPGGGKTMTAELCEYMGIAAGAVVIHVDPSMGVNGLERADEMSRRLLAVGHHVMIVFEDVEKLAREGRAKVLEILDGVDAKHHNRIIIGTTNFVEQIDRAMLRPGRFDAVLYCGLPDKQAFTQLINVLIDEEHRGDISMDEHGHYANAFAAFEGYSYAMINNAVSMIIRSAVAASDDDSKIAVDDDALITAAELVRGHHNLLNEQVVEGKVTFDDLFRDAIEPLHETTHEVIAQHATDYTDYDTVFQMAKDAADQVVEGRINNATITDRNDNESTIYTN